MSWVNAGVGRISCSKKVGIHVTLTPKARISFCLEGGLSLVFCLKAMVLKRKQCDTAVCSSPDSLSEVLAPAFPAIASG